MGLPMKRSKSPGALQCPLQAGGADFKVIAFGNGILLIQNGIHSTGNGCTIGNIHAAVLIDIQPQEALTAFPDIFHIPQSAAVAFHNGLGKCGYLIGDFHKRASLS